MASSITGITSAATEPRASQTTKEAETDTTEVTSDMFLELLVVQIKNQDPLNPADGTQYLTQLAEFTNLEQVMGIRDELETIRDAVEVLVSESTLPAGTGGESDSN